ncbi:TetR family transcriptional regulator C-terminal domain-containing protein [Actinotalea sp. M2MS4P-6]|uniref:TetR/AcrR family transcriptional regulator n=1 Tax=Actinotalea sp. M2MS4P-6 TaxID=2983762 RepID=UPI0021E44A2C|nr:TetR family transcriptional regulator C-terminal domain-containing protein [Actinotalea sp. M2MS4P-6]MCV2393823.1 TetR family transcriptional regulator C-terminal domain-containing protein [Actinotalea sp. M2MS4P-6]
MPKIVARPERRELLIDVTWKLIVAEGLDAVTLRRVAADAGFANGAVKPYFSSKAALMEAAYRRAFDRTVDRAALSVGTRTGLDAIRRLCLEIMPLDDERRVEARVVIAFWEAAIGEPTMAKVFRDTVSSFSDDLARYLAQAREAGEVTVAEPNSAIVDELLWMMMGLQSMCWLMPQQTSARRQRAVLDRFLENLGAPEPAVLTGDEPMGS